MRTFRPLAAVAFAALASTGTGGSSRTVTRLPRNTSEQGLPVLAVGRHDVWIGSIASRTDARTVWRVDPARAAVGPTPLTPIAAPVGAAGYLGGGVAVAGREIRLGDSAHLRLIRYSRAHPRRPLGFIRLPGRPSPNAFFRLQGGAGAAWVTAERRSHTFALFRVTTGG